MSEFYPHQKGLESWSNFGTYCWWLKSCDHHLGWCWNLVNNGINYQTQLVSLPDFWTIKRMSCRFVWKQIMAKYLICAISSHPAPIQNLWTQGIGEQIWCEMWNYLGGPFRKMVGWAPWAPWGPEKSSSPLIIPYIPVGIYWGPGLPF